MGTLLVDTLLLLIVARFSLESLSEMSEIVSGSCNERNSLVCFRKPRCKSRYMEMKCCSYGSNVQKYLAPNLQMGFTIK